MINIILVSVAVLVLIVAGILLAKGHKKEQHIEKEIVVKMIKIEKMNCSLKNFLFFSILLSV